MPQAADGKLCRIRLEQGHITRTQLRLLAKLAALHGNGVIELTSRANIQLRGIVPTQADNLIHALETAGLAPKNPASDGVRNVMVNPTSGFDPQGDERILPLAQTISARLQTNPHYQTLSPKFSILIDGAEACAIVNHISDIWLSLCDKGKKFAFGLASRPPLEADDPPALGKVPFADAKRLIFGLIDILLEIRNAQPDIERMKHLLVKQHIKPLLLQKFPHIEKAQDFCRTRPKPHAHLGIHQTRTPTCFYLGFKPPLGRLNPTLATFIANHSQSEHLRLTPWQSLIIPGLDPITAKIQEQNFAAAGFITDESLAHIICCAGSPHCPAAKAPIHADAQQLARMVEGKKMTPVHLSGCAKSCAASEPMATTLLARGAGRYDLFMADKKASSPFGQLIAPSLTIEQAARILAQLA